MQYIKPIIEISKKHYEYNFILEAEVERIERQRRLEYWYNKKEKFIIDTIRDQLNKLYGMAIEKTKKRKVLWVNILNQWINDLSLAYIPPPTRRIIQAGMFNEDQTKILRNYYKKWGIDQEFLNLDRRSSLHSVILFKIQKVLNYENNAIYNLRYIAPHLLFVVPSPDNQYRPGIVFYPMLDDTGNIIIYVDDDINKTRRRFNLEGREIKDKENLSLPGGVFPWVVIRSEKNEDFWGGSAGAEDILNIQENIALNLTGCGKTSVMQSFAIPWLRNFPASKEKKIRFAVDEAIALDDGAGDRKQDFGFKAPELKIDQIQSFLRVLMEFGAISRDLPPERVELKGRATSGIHAWVQRGGLRKIREQKQILMTPADKETYIKLKSLIKEDKDFVDKIDDGSELDIMFSEMPIELSPQEKRNNQEWEYLRGFRSIVDDYLDKHPELKGDKKQAVKNMQENVSQYKEIFGQEYYFNRALNTPEEPPDNLTEGNKN